MRKNPFERISGKRALAVLLVMALAVPVFWLGTPLSPTLRANADTYRKGYVLEAEKSDRTGIFPDTTFLLTVPDEESAVLSGPDTDDFQAARVLAELHNRLKLRNPPAITADAVSTDTGSEDASGGSAEAGESIFNLKLEPVSRNTFRVTPSHPLADNTLYFFDMTATDNEIVSFAFQTRKAFGVVGTLPAHQSSYVPVDTGIEIYFSHAGINLDKAHFSISPAADGRFETHGTAVVFVPRKPLTPGTLYTVTVKKGLPLAGTDEVLPADLTFSFETNPDEKTSANPDNGWLSIGNSWLEFPTADKPVIPFNLSLPAHLQRDGKADLTVTAYRYTDAQAFVDALAQKDKVPDWAWWSHSQNLLDTGKLSPRLTYTQSIDFTTMPATWTEMPELLPAGFYLVELQAGEKDAPLKAQALLQVTDTAAWFIEDGAQTVFWLNSLKTGQPLRDYTVESLSSGASGKTDADGLATLTRAPIPEEKHATPEYYLIRHDNGDVSVYNSGYPSIDNDDASNRSLRPSNTREGNYWRYAGLDRTLYKPTDTVHFWGFARHRATGASPRTVTVELAKGGWMYPWMDARSSYWFPMLQKPLMTLALPVENGVWDGSLALPNLETGYYTLSVKQGDDIISVSSFSVENYVKPAWQITATADKKAVKPGETVNFTIQAAFFDGTPVANQSIRYNLQEPDGFREGEGKTDMDGNLTIPYQAKYFNGHQGQWWTSMYATAELPETGEVTASARVQVFLNDVWVDTVGDIVPKEDADDFSNLNPVQSGVMTPEKAAGESTRSVNPGANRDIDRVGRIVADVHLVDLDPLNSEATETDAETPPELYGNTRPYVSETPDFRGPARAGQVFRATVTRTTWERVETGEDYDFVNKVVIPRYEYREKRETYKTGTFTSDAAGRAVFVYDIPAGTEGYFSAKIETVDGDNHPMEYNIWFSERSYGYPGSVWHTLETDKQAYRDGETVTATVVRNDETPVSGRTLFVSSWQGIQSVTPEDNPAHQLLFKEIMAPNLTLDGVVFTGTAYVAVQTSVRYDAEEKRITFDIETDKESYRPGDTVTLTLSARDPQGNAVPAAVNVSLVDEALLKLSDQYTNVLDTLYGWMDNGIVRRAGSNTYPVYGLRGAGMMNDMAVSFSEAMEVPMPSAMAAAPAAEQGIKATMATGSADSAYVIRSDFRDTAYFAVTTLDEAGKGTLSFTLPHNITDWRVTVSGISQTLHGGNGQASTVVSLPFFLSETLNETYLTGDEPQVGLTSYGTALKENDKTTFTLTSPDLPSLNATVTGKAFERVHLPLGALKAGTWKVLLTAETPSGLKDAVERTIIVADSYREMTKSVKLPLANGMAVPAGTKGLTRIAVTDPERAALLDTLYGLAWRSGHRLDQRLVSTSAQRWLNDLMVAAAEGKKEEPYGLFDPETVDAASYQRNDGGYGILPYAENDLRMTALLTGLLAENGSTEALKAWYYSKLYAADGASAPALYGLAALGEPVLTELQTATAVRTMTTEDRLFLILGFSTVGDLPSAKAIWDADIAPLLESADPYVRLNERGAGKDEQLQLTALASSAAAVLRLPVADGLHLWVRNNGSRNVFTGPEDLMWVKARFAQLPNASLSFTWQYAGKTNTEDLKNGAVAFITVPSTLAGDLRISDVVGNGMLTSTFTAPLEGTGSEPYVSLTRTYYNQATGEKTNTFKLNDLIRVQLKWDISADAMDSVYEISDWLPAGLAPIDNPWQYGIKPADSFWYRSFEGRQADFVVGRDWKLNQTITYYARVTSPGTYTAEGAVMRGSMVRDSVLATGSDKVVIATE